MAGAVGGRSSTMTRRSDLDHPASRGPSRCRRSLDNGEIRGAIVDAQAGSTSTPSATRARPPMPSEAHRRAVRTTRRAVAALDTIADWIDADPNVRESGAEDAFYARSRCRASGGRPHRPHRRAGIGEGRHAAGARCRRAIPLRAARRDARQPQHSPRRSAGRDRRRPRCGSTRGVDRRPKAQAVHIDRRFPGSIAERRDARQRECPRREERLFLRDDKQDGRNARARAASPGSGAWPAIGKSSSKLPAWSSDIRSRCACGSLRRRRPSVRTPGRCSMPTALAREPAPTARCVARRRPDRGCRRRVAIAHRGRQVAADATVARRGCRGLRARGPTRGRACGTPSRRVGASARWARSHHYRRPLARRGDRGSAARYCADHRRARAGDARCGLALVRR